MAEATNHQHVGRSNDHEGDQGGREVDQGHPENPVILPEATRNGL